MPGLAYTSSVLEGILSFIRGSTACLKKRFENFNLVCVFDMPCKCEMHLENVLPTIWVYFLYVTCFEPIFSDIV